MLIKRVYPKDFEAIKKGRPFEIVIYDKNVKVGEEVIIKEWHPFVGLTGRTIKRKVVDFWKYYPSEYFSLKEVIEKGVLIVELGEANE